MNEFKVGLITLAAIVSTVYVSLKITSNQSGFGSYYEYRTILNDASGIYTKTPIKVAGISAGFIKEIQLQGTQALVTFEVIEDVFVTKNSILRVKTVGFLGDKFLDIYLGEPDETRLPSGTMVPSKTGGGIEDVAAGVGDVMTEVKEIVKKINEALTDKNQQNVAKQIVENIKQVTEDFKKVSNTIAANNSNIDRALKNLNRISEQLAYETDRMEEDSAMSNVAPMMADARKTVADLKAMVEDVKAGKGTVGKLLRDEEVVDQVSETLSGVNRLVNRINNIEAEISLFTGGNTNDGAHTQFDVDIFPGPERFFRLGIVSNSFGPNGANNTVETSSTNGGPTDTTQRSLVTEDEIKFNAQIARRMQNWSFRAGLIETTGGFGLDYDMPHRGSKYSMELFDFRDDGNPRLRLVAEYRLWNIFYTQLRGEDLISDNSEQSFTLTAGLKFTDQDLTALIGLLAN